MNKMLLVFFVLLLFSNIAKSNNVEQEKDSLGNVEEEFSFIKLLIGGKFRTGSKSYMKIISPFLNLNYNTVEGVNTTGGFIYNQLLDRYNNIFIGPEIHAAVPRNTVFGWLNLGYRFEKDLDKAETRLSGGRKIDQFNEDIAPFSNSLGTILFHQNNLKLFEKDFINLYMMRDFKKIVKIDLDLEFSERWQLYNLPTLVEGVEEFTNNLPDNVAVVSTAFPRHKALLATGSIMLQPWLKYHIKNGRKEPIPESSPMLRISYEKGFDKLLESDIDFDKIIIGIINTFDLGLNRSLFIALESGYFFNANQVYFMDFFHFPRNQAPFLLMENNTSFRLLPYYKYSTPNHYYKTNINYETADFLLTKIALLEFLGIKENLILNNLTTPNIDHFTEVGYGISSIFELMRLEILTAFLNGKYNGIGFRLGIATNVMN